MERRAEQTGLWERVLARYDGMVRAGQSVQGEDLGALMLAALPDLDPGVDLEPAAAELDGRIQRYHLDVCLEQVQAMDDTRPAERLLRRCFKGWPVSPKVMVRKLMSPETRRRKGKPVHGTQHVALGDALFDRILGDAEAEVMMTREQILPEPEDVRRAAHGHAVSVLVALLRVVGLRHRQIAQLLSAMGAVKEGSTAAQEKAVQRAALDGERLLDGEAASKRRSLAYTHHPILEFMIADEVFLERLASDPDGAVALLAACAPDLRAMKVRMALVDFSPTVVNAFRTLDRDQWPPLLQRLSAEERTILADYGAERLGRTDAELALGRRGVAGGAPAMRPVWRMFVASSLTRMALQDRADTQDVLREVDAQQAGVRADLDQVADAHRPMAEALAEYAISYLWLDRVDLALLSEDAPELAKSALAEATVAARGHQRVAHDLSLRELTIEVRLMSGEPASRIADAVDPILRRFVAACDTTELAADNIRSYLAPIAPGVARVLSERSARVADAASYPSA